ncbi:unnamed protein product [Alopecurus aequalis]
MGASPLSVTAPDLYAVCTRKRLTVKEALTNQEWSRHIRKFLPIQAIVQFVELWERLSSIHLSPNVPDSVTWKLTADGSFSVASAYAFQFEGSIRPGFDPLIWKSDASLRCKIFSWLAILGKCLTADNLTKRGWPCNPICSLCRIVPESACHLFATCSFIQCLWHLILPFCNLPASMIPPQNSASLLDWWTDSTAQLPHQARRAWCSVVQLAWWSVWKERNSRIFSNKASSPLAVFGNFRDDIKQWHLAGRSRTLLLIGRPREPD